MTLTTTEERILALALQAIDDPDARETRQNAYLRRMPYADVLKFLARIDRSGGPASCWPWTRSKGPRGYGLFSTGTRGAHFNVRANRIAFMLANDIVPPSGMDVCHRCDNPPCCNPDHLFLGTRQDNIRDAVAKGRVRPAPRPGVFNPRAKLSPDDVCEIRRLCAQGETQIVIAKRYGVSRSLVQMIICRRIWKAA